MDEKEGGSSLVSRMVVYQYILWSSIGSFIQCRDHIHAVVGTIDDP